MLRHTKVRILHDHYNEFEEGSVHDCVVWEGVTFSHYISINGKAIEIDDDGTPAYASHHRPFHANEVEEVQ